MRLYKVTLRGLVGGTTSTDYNASYVVAETPTKAYKVVRAFLDINDIGFEADRELKSVTLLAECICYPDCRTILFCNGGPK